MFTCFGCYCIQLAYVYSVSIGFACCYAADLAVCSNSHLTQLSACGGVQCIGLDGVYINVFVQLNLNLSAVMAYADVLVTSEVNIIAGFYVGCFGSKTVGRQVPACISSVAYFLQLAYVYSVSIGFACCYIDNLTVSASAAYGYCISSVSYTAGTQSNSAFTGNFGIMTENNSVINSCFG